MTIRTPSQGCGFYFPKGKRYTVFASRYGGELNTTICSATRWGRIDADRIGLRRRQDRIGGAHAGDRAGWSVASLGDVGADGRPDALVGAPGADPHGRARAGAAYVVRGRRAIGESDLHKRELHGWRLTGARAGDRAGFSVARAGDVNGDGRPDVIVGAPRADAPERNSGAAYVVFGRARRRGVDLRHLGGRGFRIRGSTAGELAGYDVAAGGDVNRDGLDDVLVGVPGGDHGGRSSGAAYVVFGKTTTSAVDLGSIGRRGRGYRIEGGRAFGRAGFSVAGAGDVDSDGRLDAIVGAPHFGSGGAAYVVFGRGHSAPVDLAAFGRQGYRMQAASAGDRAGTSVAGAGDVNGDGIPDALVGAPRQGPSRGKRGSAYVVFGQSARRVIELGRLRGSGFRIRGARAGGRAGWSVTGAGDLDGDGLADVVIGSPGRGPAPRGAAYVVHGRRRAGFTDLARLGRSGYEVVLGGPRHRFAHSLALARDANGDGIAELLVGAPLAPHRGARRAGKAYLVPGRR
jgi:hypothetical protein